MFQRIFDDVRESTGTVMRQTSLAVIAVIALFVTTSFLCAAVFVCVLNAYGLVVACLAGAAVFLIVALIAAVSYLIGKRHIEARAAQRAKSTAQTLLTDPRLLASGIQLIRVIGVKRLVPILAIGGLALGLLANRDHAGDQTPAE